MQITWLCTLNFNTTLINMWLYTFIIILHKNIPTAVKNSGQCKIHVYERLFGPIVFNLKHTSNDKSASENFQQILALFLNDKIIDNLRAVK